MENVGWLLASVLLCSSGCYPGDPACYEMLPATEWSLTEGAGNAKEF